MRLINVETLELEEFLDDQIPKYAILSHTWLPKGEVTFSDMQHDKPRPTDKPGWPKIEMSARRAVRYGYKYVWVDTCCIDKSSSAELTEAINSMFAWYREGAVCYAFLADVTEQSFVEGGKEKALKKSRWFTRGWTLQELLAPKDVQFFSAEWTYLGCKAPASLNGAISNITGIDEAYLVGEDDIDSASVARRMSWAANRTTTRIEDTAYCLLGIFGINMRCSMANDTGHLCVCKRRLSTP